LCLSGMCFFNIELTQRVTYRIGFTLKYWNMDLISILLSQGNP
jgi:hypothetical protein